MGRKHKDDVKVSDLAYFASQPQAFEDNRGRAMNRRASARGTKAHDGIGSGRAFRRAVTIGLITLMALLGVAIAGGMS